MPELKRLQTTRIVAQPDALKTAVFNPSHHILRVANDEVVITPPLDDVTVDDPHAIIISDGSFAGVWLTEAEGLAILEHSCEWEPPTERPAFAQGAVAGIATKILFEDGKLFFVIPAVMMAEFEERVL